LEFEEAVRLLPFGPRLALTASVAAAEILVAAATDRPAPIPVRRLDGSTIERSEIDQTVSALMKSAEVTGLGLVILNDRGVVYEKGYGFRDVEGRKPMTPDTVMSAASLSKAVFAYLVMTLVGEGKIDLDRTIDKDLPKPLPDYPGYADLAGDVRWRRLTPRMLLSHTSGFANWRAFEDDRKLRIHFEPGSRYAYSGEGIDLLQLVVETVTKTPLEALARKRVFEPLGMTRTSYVWQGRFDGDFANGYDEYGRSLGPQRRTTADAAGSMLTTAADYARFVQGVMRGTGLRKATRDQMLGPQIAIHSRHQFPTLDNETTTDNDAIRLSYGLGWGVYTSPRGRAFFKEGHDAGWRNYTVAFDDSGDGIVLMTNSANGEGLFGPLLAAVQGNPYTPIAWEGFTPWDKMPPRPPLKTHARVDVDPAILREYAGVYVVSPDIVWAVRWKDGRLWVQENDEPEQELLAEGPNRFNTVAEDVYTFEPDAQGKAATMTLHLDDRDVAAKRRESR
jgi:CubicO group peptidase (beta-lactamase class C family)